MNHLEFDAVIVGAGAAGLMCAAQAGLRGVRVLLVDHGKKVAEKIRISGGGRCNFTNVGASHVNYISQNPTSVAVLWHAIHPKISSTWCKSTALPFTKSTKASYSATTAHKTSSPCCYANAKTVAYNAGKVAAYSNCATKRGPHSLGQSTRSAAWCVAVP